MPCEAIYSYLSIQKKKQDPRLKIQGILNDIFSSFPT